MTFYLEWQMSLTLGSMQQAHFLCALSVSAVYSKSVWELAYVQMLVVWAKHVFLCEYTCDHRGQILCESMCMCAPVRY